MGKSAVSYLLLYLILSLVVAVSCQHHCRVSVVLVGSTGDLAKRYLWQAIFKSFMERECGPTDHAHGCGLLVVGGARRLHSFEGLDVGSWIRCETVSCEICLRKFTNSTLKVRIAEGEDYAGVSKTLADTYRRQNCTEVGRVFYLSVPPSAYVGIIRSIHAHSRPEGGAWLRVVVEKPFGSDLVSARLLASEIKRYLGEEEVYRVDHYLGKQGVQQILPFREGNSALLRGIWNSAHVQRVEVFAKERLDIKGRSEFFDKYGIIRDMHQNHLTEVLARVAMDLTRGRSFHERKLDFLSMLRPPALHHSILGQYDGYSGHLSPDINRSLAEEGEALFPPGGSLTPTYASVCLYSRDPKWRGVLFLLTAGKQLDERKALARVVFKNLRLSPVEDREALCPTEVVFLIQDEQLKEPGILLSEHFSGMELELWDWERKEVELNGCPYIYARLVDSMSSNAYVSLMDDILGGKKESFVDTDSLLASWAVWDPLLREIQSTNSSLQLVNYSPKHLTPLEFSVEGSKLRASGSSNLSLPHHHNVSVKSCSANMRIFPHSGTPALVGTQQYVTTCLAEELYRSAVASVNRTGGFHLALPGGRSPRSLFDALSLEYASLFPWEHTHIWQTDERCVLPNDTKSNWNQIDKLLLSQVSIPYHQLHPMPVSLQSGLCVLLDGGCGWYEQQLRDETRNRGLDHVVIGVGGDGHIASLFPSDQSPVNSSQWAWLVNLPSTAAVTVKQRMTLTYSALLSARAVSVVVMGKGKEEVVNTLTTGIGGIDADMPVLRLLAEAMTREHLTLYIAT